MSESIEVYPSEQGVIYSPYGSGWAFYPEEKLYAGKTGTSQAGTIVRSILRFRRFQPVPEAVALQGTLLLHVEANEPAGDPKTIVVRSAPGDEWPPPARSDVETLPLLAEFHLPPAAGPLVEIDLTAPISGWLPENGDCRLLLCSPSDGPALLRCSGMGDAENAPRLRIAMAYPVQDPVKLEVPPDTDLDSKVFPAARLFVRNDGPGLVWLTPIHKLGGSLPAEPAGIPLAVLDPGRYISIDPLPGSDGLAVRVQTAFLDAAVTIGLL